MSKSNEELVIEAKERKAQLKKEWMDFLTPIAIKIDTGDETFTLEEYLEYLQKANAYFNFLEEFVGRTSLLKAHEDGVWLAGFADTCCENLESYLLHIKLRNKYAALLKQPITKPGRYSYANLQGIVKEYCPEDDVNELRIKFEDLSLPVVGFQRERLADKDKFSKIMNLIEKLLLGKWYVRISKWVIWLGVGLLAPDIWFYIADFVVSLTQATYEKSPTVERPFDPAPWVLIGIGVIALIVVYYLEEYPKHKKKSAP